MKDRDLLTHRWSEADVDSLLTDFFRAEMPAELRRLPPSRVSKVQSRKPGGERRAAGFMGLGAAACALVLAVTALSTVGRNLVTTQPAGNRSPKESPAQPVVAETNATGTETAVASRPSTVTPPPELMRMLPPELRPSHENMAPVTNGNDDPLDLRDLLRIEVFEPRDASKRPRRVPEKRPRLPEER
jgi:hypothetical protein